jgi:hypothetical protein
MTHINSDAAPLSGPGQVGIHCDPYGIMVALKGNVTIKRIEAKVGMSFGDILSDLELAGMIHMEAKKAGGVSSLSPRT